MPAKKKIAKKKAKKKVAKRTTVFAIAPPRLVARGLPFQCGDELYVDDGIIYTGKRHRHRDTGMTGVACAYNWNKDKQRKASLEILRFLAEELSYNLSKITPMG